jgi:hypothetical protein
MCAAKVVCHGIVAPSGSSFMDSDFFVKVVYFHHTLCIMDLGRLAYKPVRYAVMAFVRGEVDIADLV